MKNKSHKIILVLIFLFLLSGAIYALYRQQKYQKIAVPEAIDATSLQVQDNTANLSQNSSDQNPALNNNNSSSEISTNKSSNPTTPGNNTSVKVLPPTELNLKMPFYSQAPFGDWSMPWQEACEEASILLVVNQYQKYNWDKTQFNQQILDLVEWEKVRFGQYEHTDVDQMIAMLKEKFNLTGIAHRDPTLENIQEILAKGHFIVAPFAGKKLGNPNYTNGGPNYHAMVIKGYTKDNKIITHDVGTRRGEDYVYSWEKIASSLHDYAEPIENGQKVLIEILPPKSSPTNAN